MFVNFIEEIHVIESIDRVVHSLVNYNSGLPFISFTFYKKERAQPSHQRFIPPIIQLSKFTLQRLFGELLYLVFPKTEYYYKTVAKKLC